MPEASIGGRGSYGIRFLLHVRSTAWRRSSASLPERPFVVTLTTHKTLRGPRGGLILCGADTIKPINSTVFPGGQGGPLMHVIAAKAIALKEAARFEGLGEHARVLDDVLLVLRERGLRIVSGGTDNHLMLVDVSGLGLTGARAEEALGAVDVTCNKNLIPYDPEPPMKASGIRLGTAAVTTRGLGRAEILRLAGVIADVLHKPADEGVRCTAKASVRELTEAFPIRAGARQAALRGS